MFHSTILVVGFPIGSREMQLTPTLEIGWLNGWILVGLLYVTYGLVLIILPRDVVARLYDRTGRSKRHKLLILAGSLLALFYFALIVFTPLKITSYVFIPGMVLYVLGLAGFVVAVFNFKNAPLGEPATTGLYKISRHPQQVMFFLTFAGACIVIGSWLALFIQIISSLFLHVRVVAEEKACLERYGDQYRRYMERVPRYFVFF
jgi:protein-S-isoprenylcysteine O-methyltransferase Ste14